MFTDHFEAADGLTQRQREFRFKLFHAASSSDEYHNILKEVLEISLAADQERCAETGRQAPHLSGLHGITNALQIVWRIHTHTGKGFRDGDMNFFAVP